MKLTTRMAAASGVVAASWDSGIEAAIKSPALARITAWMALRMRGILAYLPIQVIKGMITNEGVIRADQARRGARKPGGEIAHAYQIQAVWAGTGLAGDDGGIELAIGE